MVAGAWLGLTSMRERVRLVDGQLTIHSAMGEGTRREARVPLSFHFPRLSLTRP